VRPLALLSLLLLLAGCDVSMTQQKRYDTEAPSKWWADGSAARPLPEHVVAQGDLTREAEAKNPAPVSPALIARGRERYDIYCSPCHGLDGLGGGIVAERGFPHPPSFIEPRLLAAPPATFYDAITKGYGVMFSYADRVPPRDRWAIVAYVRALQLSQHATLAQAPEARDRLP
jgi:mono/diheme cytochrome c family protein